ncbi:hypothetical protein HWB05_gp076 [Streptomyces phage BRock]|uniref:Uncharacterized protein n=1 Tax=Streptomyces phage BRock TaxID=1913591 RepID=A0A1J0GVX3_9CAUD|nr:hypothetical protein HWB05_gp076 [Streptomyces phage BRock]APC46338.1 hypothetical protein [Streptomyces phage BRock]
MSKLKIAGFVLAIIAAAVVLKLVLMAVSALFWPLVIVLAVYVGLNVAGKVPGPFRK